MDVPRNMPEQNSSMISNFHFKEFPSLYQPETGSRNWLKDPKVRSSRALMRRRIAQYLSAKISFGMKQKAILVTNLETALFKEAASEEEYVNPETLHDRLKTFLIKHKRCMAAGQGKDCKDKQQPDLMTANGFSEFSKLEDNAEADSKNSEELFRTAKRTKMDNSCPVAPLKNQTCSSNSLLAVDAEAMKKQFNESFNTSSQFSTRLSEMRHNDAPDFIRRKHKTANLPFQEVISSQEPMEKGPTSSKITGDNEKEISDGLVLKRSPKLPKELRVDCEAAEVQTRTDSIQTQPRLEADPDKEAKPGSRRIKSFSIAEVLTTEQLKEHISSLCQWPDQNVLDGIKENDQDVCQLCGLYNIWLAPEPMYCSLCTASIRCIKRKVNYYYSTPKEDSRQYCFCTKCYNLSKSGNISMCGVSIPKETLQKRKNEPEMAEPWVQCDICKGWQHQTCGLFYDKSDLEGDSEYKCPICWLKEKEIGEYRPSTNSAVFSAKDLPQTKLSNHIEERLFRRLKQERIERAKAAGKCFDEVPGAEDLTVRVVLSTKKKITVKKQLLDTLEDESYPAEFPYTLKLILLFQKIGGVDICLFSMYVQEFGSDCGQPNQRCVYISYLDSIKYFTPGIGTYNGEALRTFAFHEILIGYLDFVKKRGFATCYIWACPPLRGDDFFFYCHPETQKIPKPEKLRQWYHSMLRKAASEEIVVNYTNLYDHFFTPTGESKWKRTAARLPYFDGDYWSGAVEDVVKNIEKESEDNPKNKMKKPMTKTTLKVMGHANSSNAATKDILLMQKLGQTILPYKKDFMVIHLQFVCTHCGESILFGKRWFCSRCKNFHLCERCQDAEQDLYSNGTHTSAKGEKHVLSKVMMDVTLDTKDEDATFDNELFDYRNKFLGFFQENHYQFDSLCRAKHSSMIILYHLRHLVVPSLGTGSCHIQKSTQVSSAVSQGERNKVKLQERMRTELLQLLKHANHCCATKADPCSYKHCCNIRMMFSHAKVCTVRASGGCNICEKAWYALNLHAKSCTEQDCQMPRCKDLKRFSILKC